MNKLINKIRLLPILLITLITISAGFILPGYILDCRINNNLSVVTPAPEEYYVSANTVIARNNSKKMPVLDKINLISGKWPSTCLQCPTSEAFLNVSEAVNLAIQQMETYYEAGVYPLSLKSDFDNWYSWSCKTYRYTDDALNTYTAYLWVINFVKYDNSVRHTVIMTEDGVILSAETDSDIILPNSISMAYNSNTVKTLLDNKIYFKNIKEVSLMEDISNVYPDVYPDVSLAGININDIYTLSLSDDLFDVQSYYIYKYQQGTRQGIGLVPVMLR